MRRRSCDRERRLPPAMERHAGRKREPISHKLRVALKELNETAIWLQIIKKSTMSDLELDGLKNDK